MDTQATIKWLKTSAIAVIGGGVAGAFAASMDPSKYHFPHDFRSGKLWEYFAEGAAMTFAALLIKSPLGQQVITAYKDTRAQSAKDKELIASTSAEIKKDQTEGKP